MFVCVGVFLLSLQMRGRGGVGGVAYVIESLKASTACPYFLFSGQPMSA